MSGISPCAPTADFVIVRLGALGAAATGTGREMLALLQVEGPPAVTPDFNVACVASVGMLYWTPRTCPFGIPDGNWTKMPPFVEGVEPPTGGEADLTDGIPIGF